MVDLCLMEESHTTIQMSYIWSWKRQKEEVVNSAVMKTFQAKHGQDVPCSRCNWVANISSLETNIKSVCRVPS